MSMNLRSKRKIKRERLLQVDIIYTMPKTTSGQHYMVREQFRRFSNIMHIQHVSMYPDTFVTTLNKTVGLETKQIGRVYDCNNVIHLKVIEIYLLILFHIK